MRCNGDVEGVQLIYEGALTTRMGGYPDHRGQHHQALGKG